MQSTSEHATPPGPRREVLRSCLIGAAVGDALGLPYEGLSARRIRRWRQGRLRHRFLLGHGLVSDDTDHHVFVAQALLASRGNVDEFRRELVRRLRLWLICLPAGIGSATLRGLLRAWLGLRRSGVRSAGNGPSMRSALLGCVFAADAAARRAHVAASTSITHIDPRAFAGALAIAEIAARLAGGAWTQRPSADELAVLLRSVSDEAQWQASVALLHCCCDAPQPAEALCAEPALRDGVGGYVLHSVPFAIAAWYQGYGDYAATLEICVRAGGDVDTNAAMAGALAALVVGVDGIPRDWREGLRDWPHGLPCLEALARDLAAPAAARAAGFTPALLPRNLLFLGVVLVHGLRRLLPPY
ncbi:ADP-ribosylglycohydrolase family protein [Tahibacter caeni]|uniref:ADP-ribosylglycohydrolase family protein n=1 Tax=Tahibacter caeni TaxID=1453545 RepID=UPI002148A5A0|nr:ADP-ribosylglycohydrolase family protein [Tahibacter caeni]